VHTPLCAMPNNALQSLLIHDTAQLLIPYCSHNDNLMINITYLYHTTSVYCANSHKPRSYIPGVILSYS